MHRVDAIVLGAGAAGLFCAGMAGQRGLRVLVIDHAKRLAEKVRISGGGRCNFTNIGTTPAQFLSQQPRFCRPALQGYTPADFLDLLRRQGIGWHEKHRGQLFCDDGSGRIIELLLAECGLGAVERWQPCTVQAVRHGADGFTVDTDQGPASAPQLVVATGGLSIPAIGASDFGHRLARQFGHAVVAPRPGLVPLTLPADADGVWAGLAGVALPVRVTARPIAGDGQGSAQGRIRFDEDLLFTHRGLSGPAGLQISSYWQPGQPLEIDLLPDQRPLAEALQAAKRESHRQLGNQLAQWLPQRLAQAWTDHLGLPAERPLRELRDRDLNRLAEGLSRWCPVPDGTEGWRKAEVTVGGVDTRELDPRTMGSRHLPGLHFIGEVVDVTGWLGGYNFQWAWASAAACARSLAKPLISG